MDALETLIRDTLREHAADAPTAVPPLHRRGRRWVGVAAAAVLVLGLAAGISLWHKDSAPQPAVPHGYREISYHGISLAVPANLPRTTSSCVFPRHSVLADDGLPRMCPMINPPSGSLAPTIWLTGAGAPPYARLATRHAVLNGLPVLRGSGVPSAWYGASDYGPSGAVLIPSLNVLVGVSASTRAEVNQVLDSIHPTPVDALGCPATQPRPTASAVDAPVSSALCVYGYDDKRSAGLVASGRTTLHQARTLANTRAPEGTVSVGALLLRLTYRDGSSSFVAVADGPIGPLVAAIVR